MSKKIINHLDIILGFFFFLQNYQCTKYVHRKKKGQQNFNNMFLFCFRFVAFVAFVAFASFTLKSIPVPPALTIESGTFCCVFARMGKSE